MQTGKIRKRLMGSDFELVATGEDTVSTDQILAAGVAEIQRMELLLTEFDDHSETGKINAHAGLAPVHTTEEVFRLLQRCQHISGLTQGAFDITSGALKKLYRFKENPSTFPPQAAIQAALNCTGYRHIILQENNQVLLAKKGMRIGFGAIGKGYAADRVKKLWQQMGVKAGVVNASGDLTAWGRQADGSPWKVGIADPEHPEQVLMWLPVDNASVATSGNYEQYLDVGGVRYSHNIDPRTGMPARFLKSVTIISPSAELSDALATAVTIMGKEVGLNLIRQLPGVHCVIIDGDNTVFTSDKIKTYA